MTVNIYDMADTWNNGVTVFNAIKMNVTNTASAAASLLMDLQVDTISKFKVNKSGGIVSGDSVIGTLVLTSPSGESIGSGISMNGGEVVVRRTNGNHSIFNSAGFSVLMTGGVVNAHSSGSLSIGSDVMLRRDAADIFAQRNGVNAQTFNIYNTWTDASNYERLSVAWATNVLTLSAQAAGTGVRRGLTINSSNGATTSVTIGNLAGVNMTGTRNIAIGDEALSTMVAGYNNVAIGHQASRLNTSNSSSTIAIGYAAASTAVSNSYTCVGDNAGSNRANLTNCTLIGSNANTAATGQTDAIAIGRNVQSSGSFGLNIGNVIHGNMTTSSEVLRFRGISSAAADPTVTELPTTREWGIHKNTSSGDVFLAYNDGGTIKKVALT